MTSALIFEHATADLAPLTDTRPACCIRTGAMTLVERLTGTFDLLGISLDRAWGDLARELTGLPVSDASQLDGPTLLINGHATLLPDGAEALAPGAAMVERGSHQVVAACLEAHPARDFLASGDLDPGVDRIEVDACLLHRPWDVIRYRDATLDADLKVLTARSAASTPSGVTIMGHHPVCVDPSASIAPTVVLDATSGPIHIGAGAVVRPLAIIVGPVHIGDGSSVLEHALVKAHTSIGPRCKVAGEVGGTIFQGFANKAHDGHLGDSWVGEWVNLGAGTTNSNLLNTYSSIKTKPGVGARHEDTGLLFLGAILGDHTKTAICTRLMTGSVIGTGCNIASTAAPPTTLAPFTWLTDEREQVFRLSKFVDIARVVMARRGVELSRAGEARLTALHGVELALRSGEQDG